MTDNLLSVVAFSVALPSPMLVATVTRPRPDSWPGYAGLLAELFAVMIVAVILTRYAVIPTLQR